MVDQQTQLMWTHLATICNDCPKSYMSDDNALMCPLLGDGGKRVLPYIQKAKAFCPMLYHTFGVPRYTRLKLEFTYYISGAVKRLLTIFKICRPTQQQIDIRLAICKGNDATPPCEYLDRDHCRQCGCPVDAKVKLAKESCPAKKWLSIETVQCRFVEYLRKRKIIHGHLPPPPSYVWIKHMYRRITGKPLNVTAFEDCQECKQPNEATSKNPD